MLPVLLDLGIVKIYSFGVLAVVGILLGMFVSWKKGRDYHFEEKQYLDIVIGLLFWALVAGRATYIASHWGDFGFNILRWLWVTRYVGVEFWGGLVGLTVAMFWYAKEGGLDRYKWLDLLSLGLAFGLTFVKVGEFLVGSGGWRYLPLLQAGLFLLLFVWLWWLEGEFRTISWYRAGKSSAQTGFLWFWFLLWLGVILTVSEYVNRLPGWWIGILASLVGAIGLYRRSGRTVKADWLDFRKRLKVG